MSRKRVAILGGGVAGMVAALELSNWPLEITLFERQAELGGKFGGTEIDGLVHEHGYHFFADYCVNVIDILETLKLRHLLQPREAIKFLRRGEFPQMKEFRNNASERYFWKNAHEGPVAWPHFVLFAYSMLELALEDIQHSDFLDLMSVNGYLASKPYMTVDAALLHQQSLLKTLSLASYRTSLSSYQRWVRNSLEYAEPMMLVMTRNSLDGFIRPLENLLVSRGVQISKHTTVEHIKLTEDGATIRAASIKPTSQTEPDSSFDALVLALPIEGLSDLMDDRLYEATSSGSYNEFGSSPPLASIRKLSSASMASLDIQFRHKLEHMPVEHVTFLQSEFDVSCIDLSQLWGRDGPTYINAVAANIQPLRGLSDKFNKRLILDETLSYLGLQDSDVESASYRSNEDAPLFLNEVGSWHDRPATKTNLPHVVVAGDYVRNGFGIASVEGAIMSAKEAVMDLGQYFGIDAPVKILRPRELSLDRIRRRRDLLRPMKDRALLALRASRGLGTTRSGIIE